MLHIAVQLFPICGGDYMKITHTINADLRTRTPVPRLTMAQGDVDSREIEITITSGGVPWIPDTVSNVLLRYRKSDGSGGSYDTLPDGSQAWSVQGNKITVAIASGMLTAAGLVVAQAVLAYGQQRIATFPFQIVVEGDPAADVTAPEDYINWARWAEAELDRRLSQAADSGAFAGACYLPAVDEQGTLSWSNDRGLEDPEPVNIADLLAGKIHGDILQGSMYGDLTMNGYRVRTLGTPAQGNDAATKEYTDAAAQKAAPRNLLDNSDFTDPVNQRGLSQYTSGYGIDRWVLQNGSGTMTVQDGGVVFAGTGGSLSVRQYLPVTDFAGKTYTGQVTLDDGTVFLFGGASVPSANGSTDTAPVGSTAQMADGCQAVLLVAANGYLTVQVTVSSGKTVKIRNIALYDEAYTAETLPRYQPRGYTAELLECQRYCFRISQALNYRSSVISANTVQTVIPIAVPMRIKPSIESGEFVIWTLSGSKQEDFTYSVAYMGTNALRIDAAKTAHGMADAVLRIHSAVILSADL